MIFSSGREEDQSILDKVIQEETIWANEANTKRAFNHFFMIVITLILLTITVLFICNFLKRIQRLKKTKKIVPTEEIIYFREIPRENATPGEALYTLKKMKTEFQNNDIGKIFSATLLDLNLKKIIDFQVDKESPKENITIKILNKEAGLSLENKDEKIILEFLISAVTYYQKETITVKELQKFIKQSSSKIIFLKNKIDSEVQSAMEKRKLINKAEKEKYQKTVVPLIGYIITSIFLICFGLPIILEFFNTYLLIGFIPLVIMSLLNIILVEIEMKKINVYTQEGVNESERWKGLKKFMEEFSLLDKREIPEITIWEKFLVYATVFGIADKVLKQLKVVYSDFTNSMDINTYSYMHLMMNTNFSTSFSNAISNSISSVYSSASGAGGGGGFSGGGRRRSEAGGGGGGR